MKYSEDLVEKIIKGLEEVPNIRHVFSKLGLHRSTYYEWIQIYPDFRKKVFQCLYYGKENISDMAEGNIIRGIMDSNKQDSKWWLSHNRINYMNKSKFDNNSQNILRELEISQKGFLSTDVFWENLLDIYKNKKDLDSKEDRLFFIKEFIEKIRMKDPEATEIFLAAYADWNKSQNDTKDLIVEDGENNLNKIIFKINEKEKIISREIREEKVELTPELETLAREYENRIKNLL